MAGIAVMAAIDLLAWSLWPVVPARAYAPEAAAAIAQRMPDALPPAARWNPTWGGAAAAVVFEHLVAEDLDPEGAAVWHRFVAGDVPATADLDGRALGAGAVIGRLPDRLSAAAAALRDAFAESDDDRIIAGIADIAVCSADLADPFRVTSCGEEEIEFARARFSDRFLEGELADLAPAGWSPPDATLDAALAMAAQSAGERHGIEDAVLHGNDDLLRSLRQERLRTALALALAVTRTAWQAARSPTLDMNGIAPNSVRVSPNPVRSFAMVTFALPAPAVTRIEVIDVAGRRVWEHSIGQRPAGSQGASFGSERMRGLQPGLYFVRVTAGAFVGTGRLVTVQ